MIRLNRNKKKLSLIAKDKQNPKEFQTYSDYWDINRVLTIEYSHYPLHLLLFIVEHIIENHMEYF